MKAMKKTRKTFYYVAMLSLIIAYFILLLMHESQKGGSQPPKEQSNTMYNFGSAHTGSASTHPGVLKAKKDKAVRDSVLNNFKLIK